VYGVGEERRGEKEEMSASFASNVEDAERGTVKERLLKEGNAEKEVDENGEAPLRASEGEAERDAKMSTRRRALTILLPLCILYAVCQTVYTISASYFPTSAEKRGVTPASVGAIFASYAVFSLVVSLTATRLAPTIGARNAIAIGLVVEVVATAAFGLTVYLDGNAFIVTTFFLRGIAGAGSAIYMIAALAVLIGEYPTSFGSVMGTFEASGSIGVMVGPLIGGLLYGAPTPGSNTTTSLVPSGLSSRLLDSFYTSSSASYQQFGGSLLGNGSQPGNGSYDTGDYSLPFYFAAGFELLVGIVVLVLLPKAYAKGDKYRVEKRLTVEEEEMKRNAVGVIELVRNPQCMLMSVSLTLCFFAIVYFDPILEPYAEENYHLSPAFVGLLFLLLVGVYAITAPIAGKIADKTTNKVVHVVGLFVGTAGLWIFGPAAFLPGTATVTLQHSLAAFAIGVGVFAMGMGIAFVPLSVEILNIGKGMREGGKGDASYAVSSLISAAFSAGAIAGPLVSAGVVQAVGFAWSSTVASFLLLLSALLTSILCLTRVFPWDAGSHLAKQLKEEKEKEEEEKKEDEESREIEKTEG